MNRIWPFRHVGLKLISLVVALLLWLAVSGEETVERGLRVPLELQQLPAGVEMTGDVPTTVDVRVRGGSSTLSRVLPGDVVAILDLRSARPGRRVFPLTADQVRVPFGVDVAQIMPSAIAIVFEGTASRQVPVVPAVDGRPAPGFVVGPMVAEPATVEVVGPESAVKRATEAVTEPVSVTNARDRVRETVILGVLDPSLRLQSTRSAVVTVQIVPGPMERTLRARPVHLRNVPASLAAQAEPTAVDVTLRGSREALSRFESDDVLAYVDLAGLGAGEYQLNVHADASREIGVIRIEPSIVQIRMTSVK
ncbi:MAG TPA: CdaR family protein [Vicinamibacterales bacterium]|nr:CdaR family protein [Vicinamibacterales bacterium]